MFSRGEGIRFISHLDLMRTWERILRRAAVPMAYTQGFNPQARIALASPLPVGVVGLRELADVYLRESMATAEFLQAVRPQLPASLSVLGAEEVPTGSASLQSLLRYAEYRVLLEGAQEVEVSRRVEAFLERDAVLRRKSGTRSGREYDLRRFVESLTAHSSMTAVEIHVRLVQSPAGGGRVRDLLDELDLEDCLVGIERTGLVLAGTVT